jgi:hypothetical protein
MQHPLDSLLLEVAQHGGGERGRRIDAQLGAVDRAQGARAQLVRA